MANLGRIAPRERVAASSLCPNQRS